MDPGEKASEWTRTLKNLDAPAGRAMTLVFIRKNNPKLIPTILKNMDIKSPTDVIQYLAEGSK